MNDMRPVIVPKSDQINADTLLGGPLTITITDVKITPGAEQPVAIRFDGDASRPYKPCKSMAKVMVHCWGPDANRYVGRSMTLYCDPKVTWGGMAVGGIRISHMTDLDGTQVMALTATKGNKKPFTVRPLVMEQPTPAEASPAAPPAAAPKSLREVVADAIAAALAAKSRGDLLRIADMPAVARVFRDGPADRKAVLMRMLEAGHKAMDAIEAADDQTQAPPTEDIPEWSDEPQTADAGGGQ